MGVFDRLRREERILPVRQESGRWTFVREWLIPFFCLLVVWGSLSLPLLPVSEGALLETSLRALALLAFVYLGGYTLKGMRPDVFKAPLEVPLISIVTILQVFLNRMAISKASAMSLPVGVDALMFVPLGFGAMLIAPLLGLRVAFCIGLMASLDLLFFFPRDLGGDMSYAALVYLPGVLASIGGAMMMRRVRRRIDLLATGLLAGILMLICHAARQPEMVEDWSGPAICLANGLLSAIVASFVLPLFEYLFGMTTDQTLLEMSDLNHPLLKRLQLEAPGTYHHSLMVATVAEEAATAIGANPLLARVCSYFHDIGKLAHPEYFTENIRYDNPHDDLHPHMSSLILLNHVKEGLDLAAQYKLNKAIRDTIAQHHGTSLIYYFFRRAKDEEEHASTAEVDYRYPGPRPRRKEIAIISLADACEAVVRSLEKPTPQKIASRVEEMIRDRILDHQLDDANLTFAELAIVQESIIKTLSGMMHNRIRYQEEDEEGADANQPDTADEKAPGEKPETAS